MTTRGGKGGGGGGGGLTSLVSLVNISGKHSNVAWKVECYISRHRDPVS